MTLRSEDQADGLRRFTEACVRYQMHLSYAEIAHLLAWHYENEQKAAANRAYEAAGYHKRRQEELNAVLKPQQQQGNT